MSLKSDGSNIDNALKAAQATSDSWKTTKHEQNIRIVNKRKLTTLSLLNSASVVKICFYLFDLTFALINYYLREILNLKLMI